MGKEKETREIGRPTLMTKDVIDKLEYVYSLDGTDREACLHAGISPDCLYKYQREHPDFIQRKEALKEAVILKARNAIVSKIEEGTETAKWYLSRKKKEEFSERSEITGANGRDLVTTLTDEEKEKLNKILGNVQ